MQQSNRLTGVSILQSRLLLLLLCCTLGGCGAYGEPLFLAKMYNANDPCQRTPMPDWCGASKGRVTIYNTQGQAQGYIKK